jgi:hypothetical protein
MTLRRGSKWHALRAVAACGLLIGAAAGLRAQGPEAVTVLRSARSGGPARFDVSPPLSADQPMLPAAWTEVRPMPEPLTEEAEGVLKRPHADAEDPVVQSTLTGGASPVQSMPAPLLSFDGIGNIAGVMPPDTNGDVGPNHYVQMVNLAFQIWDKRGRSVYGPASLRTLWKGFGLPCEGADHGDPVVLYDPLADRWLLTQFIVQAPYYGECLAVSTGPDPAGAYYRYYYNLSEELLYDYPHFGVWPDAYYMAANKFGRDGSGFRYAGAAAIAFERAKMLAGDPDAGYQEFTAKIEGTLQPADLDGVRPPPAGAENLYAQRDSRALNLYGFHVDWADPRLSTFSGPTVLRVAPYSLPCGGSEYRCVPQPRTGAVLDTLWDRVMHRFAYRNLGTHESWAVNHTVRAGGPKAASGIRWYEVRRTPPGAAPVLYQQGTYDGPRPDGVWRWMGSIAMDGSGNLAVGYSVADGSGVYPGLRYAGRLAGDRLNALTQGEATLIPGGAAQTSEWGRWGDYAAMSVDPADDCTFWFTGEYYPANPANEADWKTRIGAFRFPQCQARAGAPGSAAAPASP